MPTFIMVTDSFCAFRIDGSPAGSALLRDGIWSYVGRSGILYKSRCLDSLMASAYLHGDFTSMPVEVKHG